MIRIRDAKLTDEAAELVIERKRQLEKENGHCPMHRGIVVNILLKELAEIRKIKPVSVYYGYMTIEQLSKISLNEKFIISCSNMTFWNGVAGETGMNSSLNNRANELNAIVSETRVVSTEFLNGFQFEFIPKPPETNE